MFLVLIIIQIIVITQGSERIAGVAAQSTLHALPLKLTAIGSEMTAGAISLTKAADKREKIQQESDFVGLMDGAGKFVQGDARAAIVAHTQKNLKETATAQRTGQFSTAE